MTWKATSHSPEVAGSNPAPATADVEIYAREVVALKRQAEEILARHTGQPLEKVASDMDRDYYMTAEEARAYGIVDRVIEHH